jgi:hypothetical protein
MPFELVYGLDVTLLVHLNLPVYYLHQGFSTYKDAVHNIMDQLIELDENKRKAFDQSVRNQGSLKGYLISLLGQGPFKKVT